MGQLPQTCPECGSPMAPGFAGASGFLRWFDRPGRTWTQFHVMLAEKLTDGWRTTVPASRRADCGLVMFFGKTR